MRYAGYEEAIKAERRRQREEAKEHEKKARAVALDGMRKKMYERMTKDAMLKAEAEIAEKEREDIRRMAEKWVKTMYDLIRQEKKAEGLLLDEEKAYRQLIEQDYKRGKARALEKQRDREVERWMLPNVIMLPWKDGWEAIYEGNEKGAKKRPPEGPPEGEPQRQRRRFDDFFANL